MTTTTPTTQFGTLLVNARERAWPVDFSIGADMAWLVGSPDPNQYMSISEYRMAVIDWEQSQPGDRAGGIFGMDTTEGGSSLVVCLGCMSAAGYLKQPSRESLPRFLDEHVCA